MIFFLKLPCGGIVEELFSLGFRSVGEAFTVKFAVETTMRMLQVVFKM